VTLQLVGAVARSDIGHVREGNEDSAYAGSHLLAVADGMGGHAAGEVASSVTITALARLDDDVPGADLLGALRGAVEEANAMIRDMVAADPHLSGMGTTLTAILTSGQRVGLVHIGDSRAYLLRDNALSQITHDHTYVQDLVDAGQITAEEASHHPRRSLLLRALDGRPETEMDLRVREAHAGDRYLLCSDGLSSVVTDATIGDCLRRPTPEESAQALIDLALRAGGPDNITVVVADVTDSTTDGAAAPPPVPQVAGAAAVDQPGGRRGALLSAAGRAALIRPRRRRPEVTTEHTPPAHSRKILRPLVLGPVGLIVVLIAAGIGTRTWLEHQWFVSSDHGTVVIERGVPGSVAGLHLHHVVEPVEIGGKTLLLSQLTEGSARDVSQGNLTATSLAEARVEAQRLGRKESNGPTVLPTPAPSPTPVITASASVPPAAHQSRSRVPAAAGPSCCSRCSPSSSGPARRPRYPSTAPTRSTRRSSATA
jgi:serine/threonine protein phosphatase PrpC